MPELKPPQQVVSITDEAMATFSAIERFLSPLGVRVVCLKCDTPFFGANSDMDPTYAVSCRCRELRTKNKAPRKLYTV